MWSSGLDTQLIITVKSYPCLYDIQHKDYSDKAAKESLWTQIGHQLSVSGDYAKKRWYSLRKRYNRDLRPKKAIKGRTNASKRHKWMMFPLMDAFLHPHIKPRFRAGSKGRSVKSKNSVQPTKITNVATMGGVSKGNSTKISNSVQPAQITGDVETVAAVTTGQEVISYSSPQWEPENVISVPVSPNAGHGDSLELGRPLSSASEFSDWSDWGSGNSRSCDIEPSKEVDSLNPGPSTPQNKRRCINNIGFTKEDSPDPLKESEKESESDKIAKSGKRPESGKSSETEEDTFAKTVAIILKNLKKRDARKCSVTRIKILQLLHEAQYGGD